MSRPDYEAAKQRAERMKNWTTTGYGYGDMDHELGNLARAYLELSRKVEALAPFTGHTPLCLSTKPGYTAPKHCNCGYSTALSEASQNE